MCYNYCTEHDIIFTNSNKLYLPAVFIGTDTLKDISDTKYIGFSFCDSKSDDNDMLRQMRSLYAKSTKLLHMLSHWWTNVKLIALVKKKYISRMRISNAKVTNAIGQ